MKAFYGVYISTSWAATLAGTALFLLWSIVLLSGAIPAHWASITWSSSLSQNLLAALIVFPHLAFIIGWSKGFPRWSYPYAGQVLFFSLYMMRISTPGMSVFGYPLFGQEPWEWRAFIPAVLGLAISLAVTRSVRPLTRIVSGARKDWTLLTFAMFGFLPLIAGIGFDEIDRRYSRFYMVILALVMAGTAFLYMRSTSQSSRIKVLLGGILATIAITVAGTNLYWQHQGPVALSSCTSEGIVISLVMFSPAVLGLAHYKSTIDTLLPKLQPDQGRTLSVPEHPEAIPFELD